MNRSASDATPAQPVRSSRRPLALVTGASGGIGLELARQLAGSGHDLVLVARNEDALRALQQALAAEHGTACTIVAVDLARADAVDAIAAALGEAASAIDVLINNAGFGTHGPFASADPARETAMIQVNVTALTALTSLVLPAMVARGHGRILNVASTAAFQPGPLMSVYYASKAYVLHFSEALAEELHGSGVTVTALCPGPTRTGFQAKAQLEESRLAHWWRMPTAASVATAGLRAMQRGQRIVIPGVLNRFLVFAVRLTPRAWVVRISGALQRGRSTPARDV